MNSNPQAHSTTDAVRQSLRHAGSLFERLLYLGRARNAKTNRYNDPVLALDFDPAELDEALRQQHARTFASWLALNLEQQHAELLSYLGDNPDATALPHHLLQPPWYERLVPPGATSVERELFLNDFEIVTVLVESGFERQPVSDQSGASVERKQMAASTHPPSGAPTLRLTGKAELRTFLDRVFTKEYLARQYEKGKIKAERYIEEINNLRKAEALPPILSVVRARRV